MPMNAKPLAPKPTLKLFLVSKPANQRSIIDGVCLTSKRLLTLLKEVCGVVGKCGSREYLPGPCQAGNFSPTKIRAFEAILYFFSAV